jgi:hypothetical protein
MKTEPHTTGAAPFSRGAEARQRFLPPPERLPGRLLPLLRAPPVVLREAVAALRDTAPDIFLVPPARGAFDVLRDPPEDLRAPPALVFRVLAVALRAPPLLLRAPPRPAPDDRPRLPPRPRDGLAP